MKHLQAYFNAGCSQSANLYRIIQLATTSYHTVKTYHEFHGLEHSQVPAIRAVTCMQFASLQSNSLAYSHHLSKCHGLAQSQLRTQSRPSVLSRASTQSHIGKHSRPSIQSWPSIQSRTFQGLAYIHIWKKVSMHGLQWFSDLACQGRFNIVHYGYACKFIYSIKPSV